MSLACSDVHSPLLVFFLNQFLYQILQKATHIDFHKLIETLYSMVGLMEKREKWGFWLEEKSISEERGDGLIGDVDFIKDTISLIYRFSRVLIGSYVQN